MRKGHRDLKRQHTQLVKSKREKQGKLLALEARAYDVQMLKFGRVVDLDRLERLGSNRSGDELRDRLARDDAARQAELDALDDSIYAVRERLVTATRENTARLGELVSLAEERREVEGTLDATQRDMTSEYRGLQRLDWAEVERLEGVAREQRTEIERLKHEIHALISK